MDQEDRIYTSEMISMQHYIIDSNHGNETQPNKDFKVFKTHPANDRLITLTIRIYDTD